MRKILIILLILVVAVAVGLYFVYKNIDAIVEQALETEGSKATQSEVAIDDVTIDFKGGSGSIDGLSIGNPPGFSDEKALSLGAINLAIDTSRSTRKLLVVRELKVVNPVITYEVGAGKSNMSALQKNVEAFAGGGSGGGSGSGSSDKGLKFEIEDLIITGGEVKLRTKAGKIASSDLPTIRRTNLGSGGSGITGAELGEILISAITQESTKVVTSGALKGLLDQKLPGPIGEGGGKIKEGIGSLFGGD